MCLDLRVEMRVQKEGLAEAPAAGAGGRFGVT